MKSTFAPLTLFLTTVMLITLFVTLPNKSIKREIASLHPLSPVFERAEDELGFPRNLRTLQTISFDLNGDRYPDFIFNNWAEANKTTVTAYLNMRGKKFEAIEVRGLDIRPYAELKLVKGLFAQNLTTAIVRYLEAGNFKAQKIDFFDLKLLNNVLTFTKREVPSIDFVGNMGDFTVLDFNRDGLNDLLFVSFYYGKGDYEAGPVYLYKNLGNGTFTDVASTLGVTPGGPLPDDHPVAPIPSYAVSSCDINNDGYPDILIGGYGRRWNKLFINQKGDFFENQALMWNFRGDDYGIAYFRGNGNSFVSACGDADNDGDLDVFQGEITHKWAGPTSDKSSILWNENLITFTREMLMPRPVEFDNQGDMGAMWGDMDLDGYLDLMVANSDYPPETQLILMQNSGFKNFHNRSSEWLSDGFVSQFINPRGAILVDFDLDGDLDLVSSRSFARWTNFPQPFARIYKNTVRQKDPNRNFISFKLVGNGKDVAESPYGARVKIKINDQIFIREYAISYGGGIQHPEEIHFGLPTKLPSFLITVHVLWPNGKEIKYSMLEVNTHHILRYK